MNWRNWWNPASEEQSQAQPETLLGYLLEPRMVFDGAVVATTVEVAADAAASTPTETASDAAADSAGTSDATADTHHGSSLYVAAAVGPEASTHESAPVPDGKTVVFVDTSVSNYQGLLAELPSDIEVVLLDGSKDGLSQMADWAQSHTGYDAIHIISHGTEGSLTLGATQLNSQSLASHSGQLQTLGQALTPQGDILLYGCDVAAGTQGQQFITELATLTGADVAASSDDTGSASLGGNWQLEQHVGTIEAHVISSDRYSGLLATFDLTDASGNGTREIKQTVGSDTLVITAKDTVLAVDSDDNFWGGGIASVSGDVILSDSGLSSESQITLTVSGNKIFDLSSFVLVDYAREGKGITITTDKGSETFSAAFIADDSWSLSLADNSMFQGITYAKIETSDPSGQFCWAFDNFVLNNIQLPDTTAPNAPSVPVLDSASDLGSSNSDFLTSDNTPTFSGTAEPGSLVKLYRDDFPGVMGMITADASGNWTITSGYLTNGTHTVTATATDAAGNVSVASAALTVTIDTQEPGSASGSLSVVEGSAPGSAVGTVTASDGAFYSLLDDAGGRFAIDGSTGAITVVDGSLLDFESATSHSITVQVMDAAGNTRDTSLSVTIIDSTNEAAPVISSNGGGASATISLLEGATSVTTVTASDADSGSTLSYSIAGGVDGALFTINPTTGALSFVAAPDFEAPTDSNADNSYDVTVQVSDGLRTDTQAITVHVGNSNDAPTLNLPTSIAASEDVLTAVTGISFSDVDAGSNPVTVTLAAGSGALTALSGSGVIVAGSGSSTLVLSGSVSAINSFIATSQVGFTTVANSSSDVTLAVTIDDGGNSGSGGVQSANGSVTLDVSAVNDAPSVAAPGSIVVTEDVASALTGISFTDVDAGSNPVTVTLAVNAGTLAAVSGSGVSVGGSATSLTLSGSISDINSFIAAGKVGFTTASDATGNVTLTTSIHDGGNTGSGGDQSDSTTTTLGVSAVNDAPVNHLPASQSIAQDASLVFSSANGNPITISDVDAGAGTLQVTLTATHGVISLSGTTGLSFSVGDGSSDQTMTFEGSAADINNALNGLSFTPSSGFSGSATLSVATNDLGGTGSGGSQLDSDSVTISINNPPTANPISAQNATEDAAFNFTLPSHTFSDVDAGDSLSLSATLADGSPLPSWLSFNPTTGTFTGAPDNGDVGSVDVRVTATDGSGASASSDFSLNVANSNDAPLSQSIADQNATEDSAFSFTLPSNTFSDVDAGDSLSLSATLADGSPLPSWLSFDASTGTFTGTPDNGAVGSVDVRVTATDGSGASVSSSFMLNVANSNDAPLSQSIANQNATEDAAFNFTLPSNTFSDVDVGDSLSLSATLADGSPLPSWLSFNPTTGTFTGTPDNGDVGSVEVRVTATDGSGASASSDFSLNVANSNDAPLSQSIADQNATEDSVFSFTLPSNTFSDVDVGDSLSLSATQADGSPLPSWLSFDASTGTFSGTPDNGAVGSVEVRVTATDGSGASASSDFSLNVANSNDAPLSQSIADQNATEDAAFNFTLPSHTFSDVDAGDSLSLSATLADGSPLPSWLSFNPTTGTFTGTPDNGAVGSVDVRVTATDGSGASASSDFSLTVANSNDAPLSQSIADQNATEDAAFNFTLPSHTFSDVDAGDSLSLSATLADGSPLPSWLSFNPTTGTFSGTPDNGDVGSVEVRVTATDGSGASVSSSFMLSVANSNDAPVAHAVADQSASAGSQFHFQLPSGTFTDVDAGDSLTLNATLADGSPLPSWLSFDASTGTLSGVPGQTDISTLQLQITATDSQGATAVTQFQLVVGQSVQPGGDPEFKISSGTTSSDALLSEQGRELVQEPEQAPTEIDTLLAPAPLLSPGADSGLQASSVFADSPFVPGQGGSVLASIFQRDHGPLLAADSWLAPETRFTGVGGHSTLAELFMTRALDSVPALQVFDHSSWHSVLGGLEGQEGQPVASLSLQQQLAELEQEQAPQRLIDAITQTFAPGERQSS